VFDWTDGDGPDGEEEAALTAGDRRSARSLIVALPWRFGRSGDRWITALLRRSG
jgi:hypothetical protein